MGPLCLSVIYYQSLGLIIYHSSHEKCEQIKGEYHEKPYR